MLTERSITTPDGRELGLVEAGDPQGRPVVVHHGTPSSALPYGPVAALASEQGIRLIGYDRPGYGDSTRAAGRSVGDCVGDVHAIADALGLDRFACWGISGGGPHALACAAECDERLAAAAVLGSPAPYGASGLDWEAGMGEENVAEFGAALEGEQALRAYLVPARDGFMRTEPEQVADLLATLVGPADRAVVSGELARWMVDSSRRGLREGFDGWLDDDVAFVRDWGFDVAAISRPVLLLHGGDDRFVPVAHGRWLAGRIPGADERIDPDDGHLTLIERRMRETHEWLLARL